MCYDEEFMLAVERKFMKFMSCTTSGIRKDYLRKQAADTKKETSLDNIPVELVESFVWQDTFLNEDPYQLENEDLLSAMEQLTVRQKEIIIRILIEEQTEEEVAKALGISQQGVNLAKNKAKKKLEDLMRGNIK